MENYLENNEMLNNNNGINYLVSKRFKHVQKHIDLNEKIHPDCIYYNNPPDFIKIAEKCPELKSHLKVNRYGTTVIDWKNTLSLKELTRSLLKCDFGLKYWDIPDNFLIPCLTSKCNYIHWVNDLLKIFIDETEKINIIGLDIGVGANCIYPIIGNKTYNWKFIGSDINIDAINSSNNIVTENQLDSDIKLKYQKDSTKFFTNIIDCNDFIYFSMCNPPYYDLNEDKNVNPAKECEYNKFEMFYDGGEINFINSMIKESVLYKFNVLWFTTLVGKKSSFKEIKNRIVENKLIKQVKFTEFFQGKQVRYYYYYYYLLIILIFRWGIAWTYFTLADFQFISKKVLNEPIKEDEKELNNVDTINEKSMEHNNYIEDIELGQDNNFKKKYHNNDNTQKSINSKNELDDIEKKVDNQFNKLDNKSKKSKKINDIRIKNNNQINYRHNNYNTNNTNQNSQNKTNNTNNSSNQIYEL